MNPYYSKEASAKPIKLEYNTEIHEIPKIPTNYSDLIQIVNLSFKDKLPRSWTLKYLDTDDGDLVMLKNDEDYKGMLECELRNESKFMKIVVNANSGDLSDTKFNFCPLAKSEYINDYSMILPQKPIGMEVKENAPKKNEGQKISKGSVPQEIKEEEIQKEIPAEEAVQEQVALQKSKESQEDQLEDQNQSWEHISSDESMDQKDKESKFEEKEKQDPEDKKVQALEGNDSNFYPLSGSAYIGYSLILPQQQIEMRAERKEEREEEEKASKEPVFEVKEQVQEEEQMEEEIQKRDKAEEVVLQEPKGDVNGAVPEIKNEEIEIAAPVEPKEDEEKNNQEIEPQREEKVSLEKPVEVAEEVKQLEPNKKEEKIEPVLGVPEDNKAHAIEKNNTGMAKETFMRKFVNGIANVTGFAKNYLKDPSPVDSDISVAEPKHEKIEINAPKEPKENEEKNNQEIEPKEEEKAPPEKPLEIIEEVKQPEPKEEEKVEPIIEKPVVPMEGLKDLKEPVIEELKVEKEEKSEVIKPPVEIKKPELPEKDIMLDYPKPVQDLAKKVLEILPHVEKKELLDFIKQFPSITLDELLDDYVQ